MYMIVFCEFVMLCFTGDCRDCGKGERGADQGGKAATKGGGKSEKGGKKRIVSSRSLQTFFNILNERKTILR